MAVYVDDPLWRWAGRKWCHMLADSEEDCSEDGDNYGEIHFIDAYHRGWGCGLDVADINQGHWVTPYSVIAYEPSEVLELDHLIVIVPDRSPIEHRSPPGSPTSTDFALLGSELGLLGDELPFGITVIGLTFLAR